MYGRGNYGPPAGQGPRASTPLHQHPPAPSLPPFSHGSQPLRSSMMQYGPQPVPTQVGQLGHPSYRHTPPGPHQPGPPFPVPSSGVNAPRYFSPAPHLPPTQPQQVYGSPQMPQHAQWLPNAQFVPATVPSMAPRILPPPPSQGKKQYGSQVHQPPLSCMRAHPPPHQPASSSFASPLFGGLGHSETQHSNVPSTGPPPPPPTPPLPTLPAGAPPLPSFSPPPTSSFPFSNCHIPRPNPTVSDSAFPPRNGSGVSVDEVSGSCLVGHDASLNDGSGHCDRESTSKIGVFCMENLILDLPPPPPKPVDDRTIRNIEVLCQFIAKNGPEFEDMTRQKEFGNPGFQFLFGGKAGNENAVAHEYFIWMKNKCQLEFKLAGEQGSNTSAVRPPGDPSPQPNFATNTALPPSPVDSDMDMEDDITHPDEEPQIDLSNNLSHGTVSVSDDLDIKDQLQLSQNQEHSLSKDGLDGNSLHSASSGLQEQRQGSKTSSDHNQSITRNTAAETDGLIMNTSRNVESPLYSKVQKSFSPHEDSSQKNATTDVVVSSLENLPDQLVEGASPFRLLQDYTSDGSSDVEPHVQDAIPTAVTVSIEVHGTTHDTTTEENFGVDLRPKSVSGLNKEFEPLSESCTTQDFPFKSQAVKLETDMTSVMGKSENFVDNIHNNQGLVKDSVSYGSKDANADTSVEKKEAAFSMATKFKVDEFGRLIKEGASDSESDGSPRYTRRRSKRERSRSRSRSPPYRRRRSPGARKDRRDRSRSFSPKRRRSRSKSPAHWDGEYRGDMMRRDKGHIPECFDFRRGKCYRGASCRYMHHEDMNNRSKSNRNKQPLQDLPHNSRRSDFYEKNEEAPQFFLSHQHDEGRVQGLKPLDDKPGIEDKEMDKPSTQPSDKSHMVSSVLQDPVADPVKLPNNAAHVIATSVQDLEPKKSHDHYADQVFQSLGQQDANKKESFASESLLIQTPASIPSQTPGDKLQLNKDSISDSNATLGSVDRSENIPFQPMIPQESTLLAAADVSQLPPSSVPLFSQGMNVSYASHSVSVENYPAYQPPISYPHSQFPVPPNLTWNSLPPPPPLPHPPRPPNDMFGTLAHGNYSSRPVHFQQNVTRNQFLAQTSTGPYITEFPTTSHVGHNHTYPLMSEPERPPYRPDELQPRAFSTSQTLGQLHGGPTLTGEDSFTGRPSQGLYPLNSQMPENLHSQALQFSREPPFKGVQGFQPENLLPGGDRNVVSSMSRYKSDPLDGNLPSHLSDFGLSRISNHFNPYASTFEQPLSSKFSSNILIQGKDRPYASNFGAAHSFSHGPGNTVQGAEGNLPRPPIHDQYDPLYDSIQPSSNSVKPGQDLEVTDESDVGIRLNGLNKPSDMEENKKQKGFETIAVTPTSENEEYGETADAEVGDVEDGSPISTPNDAEDIAAGEVEIDQFKTHGKRKKSKDSRSMKLFKVSLASFVKEVLKPSWRQGNMSKEAFKTIVKKTVDKVSGAMKSHHIPKSQAKINHYIDSS